jgi:uncharacterized protein (DUF2236 family)
MEPQNVEPAEQVRAWLADRIRGRVVGEQADERTAALFDAPGERWFEPGAPIRRVHLDASMFIGGIRALLLQSLHPLAMTGVAQHSDYRNDPWGRLQRTADFLATTTFGPADIAERSIDAVRAIHDRVTGVTADGTEYRANDPHLLSWVHVAEVDSFLRAFDRYGSDKLTDEERNRYVEESGSIARRLGANEVPSSVREVEELLETFRPELAATSDARDAAKYLLIEPPLPLSSRPAYGVLAAAGASLLPLWARRELRIPWLPVSEAFAIRPAAELVTRTIRWALQPTQPSAE